MDTLLTDYSYHLPQSRIAQRPAHPRDHSRLLILDRKKDKLAHKHFYDLPSLLNKGDVLVLNNTKVFPARLLGEKKGTGGKVEIFLLKEAGKDCTWEVLIGTKKPRIGLEININKKLKGKVVGQKDNSVWLITFNTTSSEFIKIIEKIGHTPIPPYISIPKSKVKNQKLEKEYQTVFAKERGSVAAPTAGLHFTPELLKKLKKKGVQIEYITLHVGLGTFEPVKVKKIKDHKMHEEWAEIDKETTYRLNKAKKEGRRIIAVGTTSVRTLEALNSRGAINRARAKGTWVNIYIFPGYKYKFVDAMITNFHLPKSTLLMLVSAFVDRKRILKSYEIAIKKGYRFYSFGDAMMLF